MYVILDRYKNEDKMERIIMHKKQNQETIKKNITIYKNYKIVVKKQKRLADIIKATKYEDNIAIDYLYLTYDYLDESQINTEVDKIKKMIDERNIDDEIEYLFKIFEKYDGMKSFSSLFYSNIKEAETNYYQDNLPTSIYLINQVIEDYYDQFLTKKDEYDFYKEPYEYETLKKLKNRLTLKLSSIK